MKLKSKVDRLGAKTIITQVVSCIALCIFFVQYHSLIHLFLQVLMVANRDKLDTTSLYVRMAQIQSFFRGQREYHENRHAVRREFNERVLLEELALELIVCPGIAEPGSITPLDRLLKVPSAFINNRNAEKAWVEGGIGRHGTHVSAVAPKNMQVLPGGHSDNSRLGPNCLFTAATLQLISHLPNDPAVNIDKKIWFGGLGVQRAIMFWLGHYPIDYPTLAGAIYLIPCKNG